MLYVLDTNSIRVLSSYYPATFPTFWREFDALVESGRVLSVEEAKKELDFQLRAQHLIDWVEGHAIFYPPTADEMQHVANILAVPHFQQLVSQRAVTLGQPVADPWLVARGLELEGCVVTEEQLKPNAAKLPNVCGHFGVPCINLETMLRQEGWRY